MYFTGGSRAILSVYYFCGRKRLEGGEGGSMRPPNYPEIRAPKAPNPLPQEPPIFFSLSPSSKSDFLLTIFRENIFLSVPPSLFISTSTSSTPHQLPRPSCHINKKKSLRKYQTVPLSAISYPSKERLFLAGDSFLSVVIRNSKNKNDWSLYYMSAFAVWKIENNFRIHFWRFT